MRHAQSATWKAINAYQPVPEEEVTTLDFGVVVGETPRRRPRGPLSRVKPRQNYSRIPCRRKRWAWTVIPFSVGVSGIP